MVKQSGGFGVGKGPYHVSKAVACASLSFLNVSAPRSSKALAMNKTKCQSRVGRCMDKQSPALEIKQCVSDLGKPRRPYLKPATRSRAYASRFPFSFDASFLENNPRTCF